MTGAAFCAEAWGGEKKPENTAALKASGRVRDETAKVISLDGLVILHAIDNDSNF